MKCPECGAELSGQDKFCNNCGAAVPNVDAESSSEAPPENNVPAADQETLETASSDPDPLPDDEPELEEIEPIQPAAEPEMAALPASEPEPLPAFEPPADGPPPVIKTKSKRNTGLIIAIVVLVILLLCCCCVIGVIALNWEEIMWAIESQL